MSDELKLRIVGLCILAAFPLFGGGQALLESELHWLGLLMCLSNSIAVISVGFLMRPVIASTAPRSGNIYLVARTTEGLLLGISAMVVQGSFLGLTITSDVFYQLGMIALGLGSLPMCRWLIRSKFVPTMLGALGFAGYLFLVAAMIASAYSSETASMALLLPSAAFEVIFGLFLVFSGIEVRMQRLSREAELPESRLSSLDTEARLCSNCCRLCSEQRMAAKSPHSLLTLS